jgi:hypothetical protein
MAVATSQALAAPINFQSFTPQADLWVKLRELPSEYSSDRALLICQVDAEHWVAWVPDHGEIWLDRQAFLKDDV